ncbi:Glucose-methanol-choline oxidoreductase [Penicillium griseofulvum]|uniref:Glucose-methanol-choline oxidoreductase n=1 Tax=Penicillium patulum TaxID=5078 RepID=A0A135LSI9_PENPA|nr:Glucose-methanol-choline oxidoreductase [Penicillium griseofulvum]KXG51938.1 Glucose-methanol-choline oxidoreductase [Penicillium griseofulvum]
MLLFSGLPLLTILPWVFHIFGYLSSGNKFNAQLAGNATFDYVVVGGGTAGLTIATRLAEQKYKVAVVEAGGYYEYNYPLARVPASSSFGAGADVKTKTPIDWGSASNFMMYQRPSVQSMAKWAELVNDPSYLYENALPFFKKTVSFSPPIGTRFANATPLFNSTAFDKDGQPLQVSYPKYATPFGTWAKGGLHDLGIEEVQDFNSGSLIGHQFCAMTIRQSDASRSSSESAFLQTGSKRPSWTLYQFTMAKTILFDHRNRATGVVVQERNQFVLTATREVILSAGAFQSPQLLMVSGIGPANVLSTYNVKVVVDLPGVGQNMWDHVFFGPSYQVNVPTLGMLRNHFWFLLSQLLTWVLRGNGFLTNPSTDYVAFEKLPPESRSGLSRTDEYELAWFPSDWPEVEYIAGSAYVGNFSNPFAQQPRTGQYASIIAVLVAPTSRGNVTIRSSNTADAPVINPNWLDTETDQRVAVAAYRRVREAFRSQAMASVIIGQEYFPGKGYETDAELLHIIKSTVMTIYHAACTCKMGIQNDSMAVVDSRARVFGVAGLRVVDASAFPILPPGHPQSAVYMLAEKIAADIISNGSD